MGFISMEALSSVVTTTWWVLMNGQKSQDLHSSGFENSIDEINPPETYLHKLPLTLFLYYSIELGQNCKPN